MAEQLPADVLEALDLGLGMKGLGHLKEGFSFLIGSCEVAVFVGFDVVPFEFFEGLSRVL